MISKFEIVLNWFNGLSFLSFFQIKSVKRTYCCLLAVSNKGVELDFFVVSLQLWMKTKKRKKAG